MRLEHLQETDTVYIAVPKPGDSDDMSYSPDEESSSNSSSGSGSGSGSEDEEQYASVRLCCCANMPNVLLGAWRHPGVWNLCTRVCRDTIRDALANCELGHLLFGFSPSMLKTLLKAIALAGSAGLASSASMRLLQRRKRHLLTTTCSPTRTNGLRQHLAVTQRAGVTVRKAVITMTTRRYLGLLQIWIPLQCLRLRYATCRLCSNPPFFFWLFLFRTAVTSKG